MGPTGLKHVGATVLSALSPRSRLPRPRTAVTSPGDAAAPGHQRCPPPLFHTPFGLHAAGPRSSRDGKERGGEAVASCGCPAPATPPASPCLRRYLQKQALNGTPCVPFPAALAGSSQEGGRRQRLSRHLLVTLRDWDSGRLQAARWEAGCGTKCFSSACKESSPALSLLTTGSLHAAGAFPPLCHRCFAALRKFELNTLPPGFGAQGRLKQHCCHPHLSPIFTFQSNKCSRIPHESHRRAGTIEITNCFTSCLLPPPCSNTSVCRCCQRNKRGPRKGGRAQP